ncbi:hypothetical protein CRUP_022532 [Coryphaenoides rupestris]|nr:hypothetical protein CRUP_022532 [Coryphaenoides rupestris]
MPETAEAVSATFNTNRNCTLEITNDDHTATGAVGLLTYDLFHMQSRACTERLAVVFSVPFDHNLYKNKVVLGVYENSRACDKKLYELMYGGKDLSACVGADADGSGLVHKAATVA